MSDPPLKKQREKCYTARDAHFKCLDDNDQDLYKCKATLEKYEADCPKIWVS
jgi:cytochrome c oxidase assembly factor 6